MASFNVNNDAVVVYTNRLEKLNRSAFPVAVRQTLTNVARDVKTRSVLMVASNKFTQRNKFFFKAFTGFIPAKGFNVKSMASTVGVFPKGNEAAKNLETQEFGGTIGGRSFIPTDKARTGGSYGKSVAKRNKISNFKNTPKIPYGNKKQFHKKTSRLGNGDAYIYGSSMFVIRKVNKNGSPKFKSDKIFTYRSGRKAKIGNATHFMKEASLISSKKMFSLYKKEANRQIDKILRR